MISMFIDNCDSIYKRRKIDNKDNICMDVQKG